MGVCRGKKLNGLVKRRAAEREMCLEGVKGRGLINEAHKQFLEQYNEISRQLEEGS